MTDLLGLWDFLSKKSFKVRIRVEKAELGQQPAKTKAGLRIVWCIPTEIDGFLREDSVPPIEIEEVPVRRGSAMFDKVYEHTCGLSWIFHVQLLLGTDNYKHGENLLPVVATTTLSIFHLFSRWSKEKEELIIPLPLFIFNNYKAMLTLGIHFGDDEETKGELISEEQTKTVGRTRVQIRNQDGTVMMNTPAFLANFDRYSSPVADHGNAASSSIISALVSTWLLSNPGHTPALNVFEKFIINGTLEWWKLYENQDFGDAELNIDVIINISSICDAITVHRTSSGLFDSENLNNLNLAAFDTVWEEVEAGNDGQVWIVRFNSHFFVVKFDPDATYVIDSSGHNLSPGFDQAYIARFDESSWLADINGAKITTEGRDCCREFFKRFWAQDIVYRLEASGIPSEEYDRYLKISFHNIVLKSNYLMETEKQDDLFDLQIDYVEEGRMVAGKCGKIVYPSQDGKVKLTTQVYYSNIDQSDEKAGGHAACSVLATIISHWLVTNTGKMPTARELDILITAGSSRWQELRQEDYIKTEYPIGHLDIDLVVKKLLLPIDIINSKFKHAVFNSDNPVFNSDNPVFNSDEPEYSFDDVWPELVSQATVDEAYIVGWNEHFFVLKFEKDACYLIDTLGYNLYEDCHQAYILRFDSRSTVVEEETGAVISEGVDCVREFIKSFRAKKSTEKSVIEFQCIRLKKNDS